MREQADFATILCALMTRARRTNSELAALTGISVHTIENWTAGKVRRPRYHHDVLKLARALALDAADTTALLLAANHPSLADIQAQAQQQGAPDLARLLVSWEHPPSVPPPSPQAFVRATAPTCMHQLRAPVGDFVGRVSELAALHAALLRANAESGLAAISGIQGMGGVGKTELAYTVAQQVRHHFPDAQLVLSLGGTSPTPLSPEQALQTIIRAFTPEATLPDDLPTLEALYRAQLHDRRVLLVADDASDAAQVRPLLPPAGCALLITSRLRFTLPGMVTIVLDRLPATDAITMLRAICARLGPAEAHTIAQRCGTLPLALRVSGTRLHNDLALSVAAYSAWLADARQRLAALHDPDEPQLNVGASLTLSYAQLAGDTQVIFRHLSVFGGAFTLDLACAVVPPGITTAVAHALHTLGRRHLIQYDERADRWRLHDLVQDVARREAATHGEHTPAMERYAMAMLDLAEQADAALPGSEQAVWLQRLEQDHDHFRAVLAWALEHRPASLALRLGLALWRFWMARGHIQEGRARIGAMLTLAAAERDDTLHAQLLNAAGALAWKHGAYAEALTYLETALQMWRQLQDEVGIARGLTNLGILADTCGHYARACQYHEESLVLWQALEQPAGRVLSLHSLATSLHKQGFYDAAQSFAEEILAIHETLGNPEGAAHAAGLLGRIARDRGQWAAAQTWFQQSLALHTAAGDYANIARGVEDLSTLLVRENPTRALHLCGAAAMLWDTAGTGPDFYDQQQIAQVRCQAQSMLGERSVRAAWLSGRTLTVEAAQQLVQELIKKGLDADRLSEATRSER